MVIALLQETYFDAKTEMINPLYLKFERTFKKISYGEDVEEVLILFISVPQEILHLHPVRKIKYTKKDKTITYDINIDYYKFKSMTDMERFEHLKELLIDSLSKFDTLKLKDFNLSKFKDDFVKFLENVDPEELGVKKND